MFLYVLGEKSLFFPLLLLLQTPQVILVEMPWLESKYGISAHWTNSIKVFQAFFLLLLPQIWWKSTLQIDYWYRISVRYNGNINMDSQDDTMASSNTTASFFDTNLNLIIG